MLYTHFGKISWKDTSGSIKKSKTRKIWIYKVVCSGYWNTATKLSITAEVSNGAEELCNHVVYIDICIHSITEHSIAETVGPRASWPVGLAGWEMSRKSLPQAARGRKRDSWIEPWALGTHTYTYMPLYTCTHTHMHTQHNTHKQK